MVTTSAANSLAAAIGGGADANSTASVLSRLESKREELRAMLARLRSEGLEIAHVAEPMEMSVNAQSREQRATEIQRADAALLSVNWAIARWGLGLGGTCATCDAEISAKRLAALPEAATCLGCASGLPTWEEHEQ